MRAYLWPAALASLSAVGFAQGGAPMGYLDGGELDVTTVIEPAPLPGDPRYDADRAIFLETRKLAGGARYELAKRDVQTNPQAMLADFSCAIGIALTPDNAPRLARLAQRAALDTGMLAARAKDLYRRERPYLIDEGPTCQAPSELLDRRENRAGYDYPSGHATWGWTWALVLAGVAPERAQRIFERGRAYAESRVVCGVHNESAIEAGMVAASAGMAMVETKRAYRSDLAAARKELARLRKNGAAAPPDCEAEARLVAEPVLPPWAQRPPAR